MTMRILPCSLLLFVSLISAAQVAPKPAASIPVKVVVVAMFEQGADTGDQPGELQYWVERDHLDQVFPMPAAYHDARMNADGELAQCEPGEQVLGGVVGRVRVGRPVGADQEWRGDEFVRQSDALSRG